MEQDGNNGQITRPVSDTGVFYVELYYMYSYSLISQDVFVFKIKHKETFLSSKTQWILAPHMHKLDFFC